MSRVQNLLSMSTFGTTSRLGAELLGVLLRDSERAGARVRHGEEGVRRGHRGARHPGRGVLQGGASRTGTQSTTSSLSDRSKRLCEPGNRR